MKNALIIDDNPDDRFFIRDALESEGLGVFEAESGVVARRLLLSEPIDIVICDLFMPDQDGFETIEMIRKLDQKIPIIVMSGNESADTYLSIAGLLDVEATILKDEALGETVAREVRMVFNPKVRS